ncbi:MAG: hypothetical protein ACE5GX_03830 [Thermoanaerobaculia bacterium]
MKQGVVMVASEAGMHALSPALQKAEGVVIEHVTNPEWALGHLIEDLPELHRLDFGAAFVSIRPSRALLR